MRLCNKIKLFLTELIKNHSKKTFGGVELQLQAFFLSALDGVNGQLHDPADFPSDRRHRYPFDARADGTHSRSLHFSI